MPHSWPIFMTEFPEAEAAVLEMANFIWQYLLYDGRENELQYENFLVQAALKEIEDNYVLANLSNLSQKYNQTLYGYSKLIKKQTGYNFKQLLKNKRLSVAERQLLETDEPIKNIASDVGYENMTHFYDLFRGKYGKTPQQYRDENRKKTFLQKWT